MLAVALSFVSFVFWLLGGMLWSVFEKKFCLSFRRSSKISLVSLFVIISLWPETKELSRFSMSMSVSDFKSSSICSTVISGLVREGWW